jgi:tetratricopeptide (TPR) repeat protein
MPGEVVSRVGLVHAELDSVANITLSRAARQWGAALLAADRPQDAVTAFKAALEAADPADRGPLLILLAYAYDAAGLSERAMRSYLDGVREDGTLIGDVSARVHALLTPSFADVLGPWLTGPWSESVRSALAGRPDGAALLAQLEVLVAHVHAVRRERRQAVQSLRAAMAASAKEVASFADELSGWFGESLEDPGPGESLHLLLGELELLLGHADAALAHADAALAGGGLVDADHPYGDTPGYELRGHALIALDRRAEANTALLTAARQSTWAEDWPRADTLLAGLAESDPAGQEVWWLRSLVRIAQAEKDAADDTARADVAVLHEALAFWDTGYELGPPRDDELWSYFLRADIHTDLAAASEADEPMQRWLAVLYGERALAPCDDADKVDWLYRRRGYRLVYSHRTAGNVATAVQLADEIQARSPSGESSDPDINDDFLAGEAAVVQLFLGHHAVVLEALNEIESHEHPPGAFGAGWIPHVRGLALLMSGSAEQARTVLTQAMEARPDNPGLLADLAACCVRQGDREAVLEYCKRVLALTEPGRPGASGHSGDRALALLRLGRFQESAALLESLAAASWRTAASGAWLAACLAVCRLAIGAPGAREALRHSARSICSAWDAQVLTDEVAALEARDTVSRWPSGSDRLSAVFAQRATEIAGQRTDLAAAEDELRKAGAPPAPAPIRVATAAAIGRMRFAAGDLAGASQVYGDLLDEDELFPEGPDFFTRALAGLVAGSLHDDRLAEAGELAEDALSRLAAVTARRRGAVRPLHVARLASAAGLARLRGGAYGAALDHLDQALGAYADAAEVNPARAVGAAWRDCLGSAAAYWDLAEHAERCRAFALEPADGLAAEAGTARVDALVTAMSESRRYLEELLGFPGDPVAPDELLLVEVTLGSLLAAETTDEVVISAGAGIRARIRERSGVIVPGMRFTPDSALAPDAFTILISGNPRFQGSAPDDEADDSPAGEAGPTTAGSGRLEHVFTALERVVEQNLPALFDTQAVRSAVQAWASENEEQAWVENVLPDAVAWLRLGALVRRLMALRIPVRWPDILRVAESGGLAPDSLDGAVRRLRDPDSPAGPLSAAGAGAVPQPAAPDPAGQSPDPAPPTRPVPTAVDVRLAFPGVADLPPTLADAVRGQVAAGLAALADSLGLAADLTVSLEEPREPDVRYADGVRVVVNGRVCDYPPTLPIAVKTYLLGFTTSDVLSGLWQIMHNMIHGTEPAEAELGGRVLVAYCEWLCFQAVHLRPSVLLAAPERAWRGTLDSGVAIWEPAEVHATSDHGPGPEAHRRPYGEWEVLADPGFLRDLSLTEPVATQQYTAVRSVFKPLAAEIGISLPPFRLTPDPGLVPGCFRLRINRSLSAPYRGIPPDMIFAYGAPAVEGTDGKPCVEPLFGTHGVLLPESAAGQLDDGQQGFMRPLNYFFSVLIWTLRERAGFIVSPARVDAAIAELSQPRPTQHRLALDYLRAAILPEILHSLAEEAVPVRSLPALIDLLLEYELCELPGNADRLAWIRSRMQETIGAAVATGFRAVEVSLLPPEAQTAAAAWESSGGTDESAKSELVEALRAAAVFDRIAPLLVPYGLRRGVWEALRYRAPGQCVLAFQDLPGDFIVTCAVPSEVLLPRDGVTSGHRNAGSAGALPADGEVNSEPNRAVLEAWLGAATWAASATFLREHITQILSPAFHVLLDDADGAGFSQHQAILRLARQMGADDVADLLVSGTVAAGRALEAIEAGDLGRLALLLKAAPSISAPAATHALIAAILALAAGNSPAARDYATYITESAPEAECHRHGGLLRFLSFMAPDLLGTAELADMLGAQGKRLS